MARRPVLRVALTGGIATGKSLCLRRFAELGAPVIDADVVARSVVEPGTPALVAIVDRFGAAILRGDGTLDRQALAGIVFTDPTARVELERIVHPAVFAAIERWFADQSRDPAASERDIVAIADVPLLYETGQTARFDRVVVTACRVDQQVARLMARDGLSEDKARSRLKAQWPIDIKRARADMVIDTSGRVEDTIAATDRVWAALNE
jgi:dephospho-CoA kinase